MTKQEHVCEFCSKSFVKESSLMAHACAKKMRWLDKSNKNVIVAFTSWKRFYHLTQPKRKEKTYKDFVESNFYNEFVNFGRWMNDTSVVHPNTYVDYVIKGNFKLKDWTKNSVYEIYLRELTVKEAPEDALERSIVWIQNWCKQSNIETDKFFETISTNKLVDALRAGRISPWLLFLSLDPQSVMNRFDNSQLKLLDNLLDTKTWHYKLKKYQKDVDEYREMLGSIGL